MSELPFRQRLLEEILPIAGRIVTSEGLPALQARRVAAEAGCSVGSLYNVFGDLHGLIIAVNIETVAMLGEKLNASFARTRAGPIEARLHDLANSYMQFALGHLNRWKAIFDHKLPEGRFVPPEYRADQARLLALIEQIIAGEIADTGLRVRAGRALFAAVHGVIALAVDHKLDTFDRHNVEEEIRFIVKAAANGLKAAA